MRNWMKGLIRSICLRTGRCERLYLRYLGYDYTLWADWMRKNRNMRVGAKTSINPAATLMDWWMITIGSNCSISACTFVTHSGGDRVIRNLYGFEVDSQRPIVVGNNVTIGINATIMYGVTIGDNCVIGAGCYVSRDVPAGTVMRPPEATAYGTTHAYVQRLVRRAAARRATRPAHSSSGTGVEDSLLPTSPVFWTAGMTSMTRGIDRATS